MSPLSSDDPKPALSALLHNLAAGLDAARSLVELDGFYATDAGYRYTDELQTAALRLSEAAHDAISRQVDQRGG